MIDRTIQEKHTGILKSLGGMSIGNATHLLEIQGEETIRLQSENINLENERYLNQRVEVRGYMGETEDGRKIMEVMSIDVAEEDEEDETDTAGEETYYENINLGFTIKYFDNWRIAESESSVVFKAPVFEDEEEESYVQDIVVIRHLPNPEQRSIERYLNLPSDPNELIMLGYTNTKIGVNQLDGLRKQSPDQQEVDIYLPVDSYIYQFTFEGTDNPNTTLNRNIFFTMVSSFEVIGLTPDDEKPEADLQNNIQEEPPPATQKDPEPPKVEDSASTGSTYSEITEYLAKSINSIAPESSEHGTWRATKFEFTDPNYVYVEYNDGTDRRKVLLSYTSHEGDINTNFIGYFEPGETTSWTRVSGENPVAGEERTVVSITDEGAKEETVVQEGYRYFESLPYNFIAQYPSNWYYSGRSGTDGTLHRYSFSNEPVKDGNELVNIDIISGNIPSGSQVSVGPHTGVKVYENGKVAIYIERDDGRIYKVYASTEYESYVTTIAGSIQGN